jgi:glycolate oxidase
LPQLLHAIKEIGNEFGFESVCYGHAGDGNLHVNILKQDITDERWNRELPKAIRQLFEQVIQLGGTLSGEHGIGLVQKPYMDLAFTERSLRLQREIKRAFDVNGILNPGKILPDA